jgi:hypothetical protein
MRRKLPPLLASLLLPLAAGCFGDRLPTEQIGGTKFDMPLNSPSAVRYPTATFTVHTTTATPKVIDSITVVFSNLKPLADPARYQIYLINGTDSTGRPVGGTQRIVRTDSTITAGGVTTTRTVTPITTPTSTYAGAPFNTIDSVRIRNVAGTPDTIGSLSTFLVLTIQQNPAQTAFTDATPKPLWFRFRNLGANVASNTDDVITATGSASFGTFAPKGLSRPFAAQGNGYSSFWDRNRDTLPELFSALVFNLAQPPLGYFYQPWMRDTATAASVKFGVLRDTVGNTLLDADLVPPPPTTATAQLPPARFATTRDEVGALLTGFTHVQLVLEPKLADLSFPGITVGMEGALGDTLQARRFRGTLKISTMKGATAVQGVTVYVLAGGTNRVIATGSTGPDGQLQIPGLPAGTVDVLIFPPAGAAVATPKQTGITIGRSGTTTVSFTLT